MGFYLLNNLAVTASVLAGRGERVLVVDWDAHHGNGTQEIFWRDPRVLYVSLHQYPLYPFTGAAEEVGEGAGAGTTLNLPMPAGAGPDDYIYAFDRAVLPAIAEFQPAWLLVSAGFDAHARDPLTDLALTAPTFARLAAEVAGLGVPLIGFLEGGYDLDALGASTRATLEAWATGNRTSRPGGGGVQPGVEHAVATALAAHDHAINR
jgi:acetoin utilization deacetylase AcuC-like enzyme